MSAKYTNQELFDKVTEALVAQGESCAQEENGVVHCVYVSGTKRCAAGHLIPDDLIDAVASSHSMDWGRLCETFPSLIDIGDRFMISRMQMAHDDAHHSDNWRQFWVVEMRRLANFFELSTKKLDALATAEWQNN